MRRPFFAASNQCAEAGFDERVNQLLKATVTRSSLEWLGCTQCFRKLGHSRHVPAAGRTVNLPRVNGASTLAFVPIEPLGSKNSIAPENLSPGSVGGGTWT